MIARAGEETTRPTEAWGGLRRADGGASRCRLWKVDSSAMWGRAEMVNSGAMQVDALTPAWKVKNGEGKRRWHSMRAMEV